MSTGIKNRLCFYIGLGFIFFLGQIFEAKSFAEELSVQARKVLANPPEKMKPSLQQELRRAWGRAARTIFREFLPGLEDKFSYHVQALSINNQSVLYFLAIGEKRSPEVTPVTQLVLEVFTNLGEASLKKRSGHEGQPLSMANAEFEIDGFLADRANFSIRSGDGIEAFSWEKGGHFVEVRSRSDVKSIAQKVQLKLQSRDFYDFSVFLLKKDNDPAPLTVAMVLPPEEADPPKGPKLMSPAEDEPGKWVFKGCYKDASSKNVVRRDVFGALTNENDMTNEKCMQHCGTLEYPIAATQFGNWCFCGSSFGGFGEADNCDMGCAGNPNEICGGRWSNSVYKLAPKPSSLFKLDQ